jgi:hypothetical protein
LVADRARYEHAARFSERFEPRRDVDTVAENVVAVDDDVSYVDAHAKLDAFVGRHRGVAFRRATLQINCAPYGIHHARELDQSSVAGGLDNTSAVLLDIGINEFAPVCLEGRKRAFLVRAYEARVADDVGGEDSGETAPARSSIIRGI